MKSLGLVSALLVVSLGACGEEELPLETTGPTTGTSGPETDTTAAEEESSDDANESLPPPTTSDPSTTTDEPTTSTDPTGDTGSSSGSGSGEESGSGLGSVRGVVIRSVEPFAGNDAIGDLYVGLLAECSQDAATVGDSEPIIGADLSAPGSNVMYEITNVPDGTFYVVAFLDDDMDAADGMPDMGDLVTADGFGPGCVEVTVADGASVVAPEAVNLNFVYPF